MAFTRSLLAAVLLGAMVNANPLILERQDTTTASTTTGPAAGLIQTTIDGKVTTVTSTFTPPGAAATPTTTNSGSASTSATKTQDSSAPSAAPSDLNDSITSCTNVIDQPICSPSDGQTLNVGNSYFFNWSPNAFATNTTVLLGLRYNDNASRIAWLTPGEGLPKERSLELVTIEKDWLDGYDMMNLTLFWMAYRAGSSSPTNAQRHDVYNVTILPKGVEHLPANIHRGTFDLKALTIALPVVIGFILLIILGLFCGMRSHRKIGLGSIMGNRKGYGTGQSRRQRLGLKKGAIRLDERELDSPDHTSPLSHNDEIKHAPQQWPAAPQVSLGIQKQAGYHERELSLGSLLTDGSARNSYRTDLK